MLPPSPTPAPPRVLSPLPRKQGPNSSVPRLASLTPSFLHRPTAFATPWQPGPGHWAGRGPSTPSGRWGDRQENRCSQRRLVSVGTRGRACPCSGAGGAARGGHLCWPRGLATRAGQCRSVTGVIRPKGPHRLQRHAGKGGQRARPGPSAGGLSLPGRITGRDRIQRKQGPCPTSTPSWLCSPERVPGFL